MLDREPDYIYKLVFLGDSGVGKTSLVERYVYDSLRSELGRTIGAILHVKHVELNDMLHKLIIWDLGGEQSFSELRELYCANASGAFLVVDRTRPSTLEHIDDWLNALYTAAGQVPVVFVENKIDLESVIDEREIQGLAQARELEHIQTSAVENTNVDKAFFELVNEIYDNVTTKQDS